MKKFYTEIAYVFGLVFLAIGTSLMERANFGLSMVVAPAYLIHLKVSEFLPNFTFGMAEYAFQGLLLILMIIVLRKFKIRYLFAFVTAVLYGLLLDLCMLVTKLMPNDIIALRVVFFTVGFFICAVAISFMFHTYISPEVYELLVKEVSIKYGFKIHRVKICYDILSCILAIIMSFIFFGFGKFEGVNIGTVICALTNGKLISFVSKFLDKHFVFVNRFEKLSKF